MRIRKQTKIWVTKSGQKIRLCDMSTEHLHNLFYFIRHNRKYRLKFMERVTLEILRRAEIYLERNKFNK